MAVSDASRSPVPAQIRQFPLFKHIDALRFLPPAFASSDQHILAAVHSPHSSSLDLFSIYPDSRGLLPVSSFPLPSPATSISISATLAAAADRAGALHLLALGPAGVSAASVVSGIDFHVGGISGVDMQACGGECVTVGGDGRVNLVKVGVSWANYERVGDERGLREFTAVRWGSECEFATGGLGFGVQWWDLRKPGGIVSQFKGFNKSCDAGFGLVNSIDIHPSRKHTCMVGGSSGTVFAWDLRWQEEPIMLSGRGMTAAPSMSEVWKVQYDSYVDISMTGTAHVLPVLVCSEDGIMAVLKHGEEPVQILVELCAINSFDVDPQNPSDIVCSLEWESISLVKRK